MHAWYSGVLSKKPISWTSDFRFVFGGDCIASVGDLILNCIFFLNPGFISSIVFIGTGFPSALANDDWRVRTDFLVGSVKRAFSGFFFWSNRYGDGAKISDVVDDFSSSSSILSELSAGMALDVPVFIFSPFGGSFLLLGVSHW